MNSLRAVACAIVVLACGTVSLPAQDTAGVGRVRGRLLDAAGAPIANAGACLPAIGRCGVTDAGGSFAIDDVRPGRYDLHVLAGAGTPLTAEVEVRAGRDTLVEVTAPAADAMQEALTVSAPAYVAGEEIKSSAYLASGGEVVAAAGALQDVLRYVQAFPGVVIGTDDFRNDLIVRGGSPLENLYVVDNVEIPNLNAFATFASAGGSVSIVDAQLLQDVTFLTGGYPASYGNRTSSVLQLALREGGRERTTARATAGFAGAGVVAEGPIRAGRGAWIASVRRSFLDLVTDDVGIGGVPAFYTFNAKATYDVTPRDRIWAVSIGGVDRIRLGLTDDSDLTSELSNLDIRYQGGRAATGVNWQRIFGGRGVGLLGVSQTRGWVRSRIADVLRGGPPAPGTPVDEQLARAETVFRERSSEDEWTVKYDVTFYTRLLGKIQSGATARRAAFDYDVASPFGTDSPYFREADQNPFELRRRRASLVAAAYVQGSRAVGRRLNVTLGTRLERFGELSATRVSPRGSVQLDLGGAVSLRGSAGRYYQQPFALFVAAFPENAALRPFRADHAVGGVFWTPAADTRLSAEVYRKRYGDYPVSTQVPSLSLANIGDTFAVRDVLFPLTSGGDGDAVGLELAAERRSRDARSRGLASVAWSRARHAGADGVLRPASFDYPLAVTATADVRLTARWRLSGRATYLSGRPFTPLDEEASALQRRAVYDTARVNAARGPAYFRADVQVDRSFTVNGRPVRLFAGVQNVTNRLNVSGYSWDRRNNGLKIQDQLGVFPILGIDWQF